MSKERLSGRIKLASYEDMFCCGDNMATNKSVYETSGQNVQKLSAVDLNNTIIEVSLEELHTFKNHPFKVQDDEKMEETIESIKEHGVLVPGIVRKREEGGYEIISGHRRKHACELAGLTTMPVIVKECNDDESTVIMVDANIQREDISISEKARAYSMKYEAIKHQGKAGGRTLDKVGEAGGDNAKAVQRYIRLSKLNNELLSLVDNGKLGMIQGVELSYLSEEAQGWVYDLIMEKNCQVSGVQASVIKETFKDGNLTATFVRDILCYDNPIKKRKVTFHSRKLDSYFEPGVSNKEIEEIIIMLLDEWKNSNTDAASDKEGGEA